MKRTLSFREVKQYDKGHTACQRLLPTSNSTWNSRANVYIATTGCHAHTAHKEQSQNTCSGLRSEGLSHYSISPSKDKKNGAYTKAFICVSSIIPYNLNLSLGLQMLLILNSRLFLS